jgi:MFS transporter, DHA2 family, glioxin efflux transporter
MEEQKVRVDGMQGVDDNSSESQNETMVIAIEYPTKVKLIMIVVALMLSMFLVSEALDYFLY